MGFVFYIYCRMEQKKILWLCSWYPGKTEPFNGDFIQRHAQAAALFNDIYVIHVTGDATGVINHTEEELITLKGVTEHIIYFSKTTSFVGKLMAQYQLAKHYRQAIKRYIEENGRPALLHVHVPVKAGLFALWVKRKYRIPFIVTEHWGIYNDVEVNNYLRQSRGFKYSTKKIFQQAAKFLSVSQYLAAAVNRLVVEKEYEVVPNVVNTDLFYYRKKDGPIFRFIHVSNMVPLKNAEGILRAFQVLVVKQKEVELVMVGNTESSIRRFAEKLKLPETLVTFRGEIAYSQVAREMQAADCLLLFSNIENSPCVIGEALCCGLPVIATNAGGIPELVDNTNAILIDPKDEGELLNAMQEMIKNASRYHPKQIAENAKSKFSYPVIGKKLDEIYNATLGQ